MVLRSSRGRPSNVGGILPICDSEKADRFVGLSRVSEKYGKEDESIRWPGNCCRIQRFL